MANSAVPVQKPTDLDLHCLQWQDISGLSRRRVKTPNPLSSPLVLLRSSRMGLSAMCQGYLTSGGGGGGGGGNKKSCERIPYLPKMIRQCTFIGPDKSQFSDDINIYISFYSMKTYVVGTLHSRSA